MTTTALLYHPCYLQHDPGPDHPETPRRLLAIIARLEQEHLTETTLPIQPRPAERQWLCQIHSPQYLDRFDRACRHRRQPFIDAPDTGICPASFDVAVLAAGGVLAAVDAVMTAQATNAFCALRPPGHHAERDTALGFCLLNNVAIAARYAQRHYGLQRVLIVDWDVHHGNGTYHAFEADPTVFYCSLHEHPAYAYPGTGWAWQDGLGPGKSATLNLPMLPGWGDQQYRQAFADQLLPAARQFQPQLVLISAGFDAHLDDPLSNIRLTDQTFDWMLLQLKLLARHCCQARIVSVLEGGYNPETLARCVARHVRLLAEPT